MDYNVRFFSTYRYTVYIPTNSAVEAEIEKGLPTWESIEEFINNAKQEIQYKEEHSSIYNPEEDTKAYKLKAQAMCTALLNFVKYHFQDDAIYNDKVALPATAFETACINAETNRYITLTVQRGGFNILTRDLQFDKAGSGATTIETSSFAVLHQIDGVLNFTKLPGGRYEGLYDTSAKARKFMAKYPIR